MGTSSARQHDDSFEVKPLPRGWLWAAGGAAVVLMLGLMSWRPSHDDAARPRTSERPLFAGWVKYGMADFGQPGGAKRALGRPDWVLASNDQPQEDDTPDSFQQAQTPRDKDELHDAPMPPPAQAIKLSPHP